jgi:pimeloyl-ACP methyl ester carboxylesterase
VPELIGSGHQVFLYDLLGFGHSERPRDPACDTSVTGQVPILVELMKHWGLDSAHIVSHDIGGAVGMRLGIFHPDSVRSLTIIDTVSFDSWPSPTWRERIQVGLDRLINTPDADHRRTFGDQLMTAVYDKEPMRKSALSHYLEIISGPVGQASFFQHQVRHYESRHTSELDDRLAELGGKPVQIIWGEDDAWQVVDWAHRLHQAIPGSTLHVLPQCGHFAMEDKPQEISDLIKVFVARHSDLW